MIIEQVPVRGDSHHQKHCQIDKQIEGVTVDRAVQGEMHKTRQLVSERERVIKRVRGLLECTAFFRILN